MLYSVRMRAAQGGAHELGGRHISGAERLVTFNRVAEVTGDMLTRAFSHTRGRADFINVTVEAIENSCLKKAPLLPVHTITVPDAAAGRKAAKAALVETGVAPSAVEEGFNRLQSLPDSMRGAMLLCAETGKRLDDTGMRGIRVSRMDIENEPLFSVWLEKQGFHNVHVREALVLAAKVAAAPGMIAELCWSDDPEYTTGYVASPQKGYFRFSHLKPLGSPLGGRIFFLRPETVPTVAADYLQNQPVLITLPEGARIQ
ncbi:MAG: 6-carboxyhexanoate--CoA ligase [Veillonellales bacterium]